MHRTKSLFFVLFMSALFLATTPSIYAGDAQIYLQRVIDFGDTMLEHGTDRYGAVHSPQFATALTRGAVPEIVVESPKASAWPPRFTLLPNVFMGSDYAHKITIRGGNVGADGELYQMLYLLTEMTGEPKYATAADASLKFFLDNTPDSVTGCSTTKATSRASSTSSSPTTTSGSSTGWRPPSPTARRSRSCRRSPAAEGAQPSLSSSSPRVGPSGASSSRSWRRCHTSITRPTTSRSAMTASGGVSRFRLRTKAR